LFEVIKAAPKHVREPELPPVLYRFFGPVREGKLQMKAEYLPVCCEKCGRYDEDDIFTIGFRDPAEIRIKGDFSHTQDRIFTVNDKFLNVVRNAKTFGFETKPIGKSGWHAFKVNCRVDCKDGVLEPTEPVCEECGRREASGSFNYANQISAPPLGNTFFTTKVHYHRMLWERDIFITEEVVRTLKDGGIKGGYCNRLWKDEELRMRDEKAKHGKKWKPPGSTVLL